MWNLIYTIYMLAMAAMAIYGYAESHPIMMWVGIVLFVIGLLRFGNGVIDALLDF